MKTFSVLLIGVATLAATALPNESFGADAALRAGAFAIDITPTKLPVPISGGILPQVRFQHQ
jgi:hypothetical protein